MIKQSIYYVVTEAQQQRRNIMIAIYGWIDSNNAVWGVVDLVTLDEYLNMPSNTMGEYVTCSTI